MLPTQLEIEGLLCRPLSECEVDNFTQYLEIAKSKLEVMLCTKLYDNTAQVLEFEYNNDPYIILPPFTTINSLEIVDCDTSEVLDLACDYQPIRNGLFTQDWFNAIKVCKSDCGCYKTICCDKRCKKFRIDANWGFGDSTDIKMLLAQMFNMCTNGGCCDNSNIESKSIEGYSVNYRDKDAQKEFDKCYGLLVEKYNQCKVGDLSSDIC